MLVTRRTRLAQRVERFNTRAQVKIYIDHAGGDFADYVLEDDIDRRSLQVRHDDLDLGLKDHPIERAIVPTFLFAASDLIVAVGQDGLVANVAKYAGAQPIVAITSDPARFDDVLLPLHPPAAAPAVTRVIDGMTTLREITLAGGDSQRTRLVAA